jgi:Uncharacterized conserved protein
MTTVEVPYSIAAALPSLSVMDITNDVSREVAASGVTSGIAYLHARERPLARARAGARDGLLRGSRVAARARRAREAALRERLLAFLLGPRSEQVPFVDGVLCLGQWQRILLFSLDAQHRPDWTLTLVG